MHDRIFEAFLEKQQDDGMMLARASDIVELHPVGENPAQRYRAIFNCRGLVLGPNGVTEADRFEVGFLFSHDYLRVVNPIQVVIFRKPFETFHPNIRAPFVCLGPITPGTELVELIFRTYELISYQRVTMREDNALNSAACGWARKNQGRFPLDRRPLIRKRNA